MNYYLEILKNYAEFNGRTRRKEYWMFVLFNSLVMIGCALIGLLIHFPYLDGLYCLAVLLPSIAAGIRRMHDVDKSGWYLLIPIYSLVLLCMEGTKGANHYGAEPKQQ